jgi:hypothetical protein
LSFVPGIGTSISRCPERTSNATIYEDRDAAEHLVDNCIWETYTRGITEAALIEAAGSDLNEYMLAKLNRVVGREVKDRAAPNKF